MGRPLIADQLARGHVVRGLIRPGSEQRLPPGAAPVVGNALDPATFADRIAPSDTMVHLVGTSHPSPAKAAEFQTVDLASIRASVSAAISSAIRHLVYVSVAQPAPVMRAYIEARRSGEQLVRDSGIPATVLRPWYVLGPGHRWPYLLLPMYGLLGLFTATRDRASRLGLVTLRQMVNALVRAIETPASGVRVLEVPDIRSR